MPDQPVATILALAAMALGAMAAAHGLRRLGPPVGRQVVVLIGAAALGFLLWSVALEHLIGWLDPIPRDVPNGPTSGVADFGKSLGRMVVAAGNSVGQYVRAVMGALVGAGMILSAGAAVIALDWRSQQKGKP